MLLRLIHDDCWKPFIGRATRNEGLEEASDGMVVDPRLQSVPGRFVNRCAAIAEDGVDQLTHILNICAFVCTKGKASLPIIRIAHYIALGDVIPYEAHQPRIDGNAPMKSDWLHIAYIIYFVEIGVDLR